MEIDGKLRQAVDQTLSQSETITSDIYLTHDTSYVGLCCYYTTFFSICEQPTFISKRGCGTHRWTLVPTCEVSK